MAHLGPTVLVRFLGTDAALSVGSIGVWAEAVSRTEQLAGRVTIAVVDPSREPLQANQVDRLRQRCESFPVGFRYESVAPGTTVAATGTALGIGPDDLLVLADPADVPSPGLVDRLFTGLTAPDVAILDAHPLPIAPPDQRRGAGDGTPAAGVCIMLSGRTCRQLGDFEISSARRDIAQLIRRAEEARLQVVSDPSAPVFCDLRVGADVKRLDAHVRTRHVEQSDDGLGRVARGSHPATLEATSLGDIIRSSGAESQLTPQPDRAHTTCFLTVLTRTQGLRPHCLKEMLLCLAAQTVRDFEVVLACHRVSAGARKETEEVLTQFPEWLRSRVRIIDVDRPGRAAPLNDGLEAANGRYVAVLDDDDLVLAHWVETFRELEERAPGRVLRAVALRQDVTQIDTDGGLVAIPVGEPWCEWPLTFELADHLRANSTPCMTVAFPRGVFHDLHYRFNEDMLTTEDWEYLVRAASIVGVESDPAITSVYRWWVDGGSSRTVQSSDDWAQGRELAYRSFDERIILLPRGGAARIRDLLDEAWTAAQEAVEAHDTLAEEYQKTSAGYLHLVDKVQEVESRLRKQRRLADKRLKRIRKLEELLPPSTQKRPGALGELRTRLDQFKENRRRP